MLSDVLFCVRLLTLFVLLICSFLRNLAHVHESMEKIQQFEQQTAQRIQERQMNQEQNQGRSMCR